MKIKRILGALLAAIVAALPLAGCGIGGNDVKFWVYGSNEEVALYTAMKNEFNDTYGKEHGIYVDISQKALSGYDSNIQTVSTSRSGPDVFLVNEDKFKSWVNQGFVTDMTPYLAATEVDYGGIYESSLSRFRYDKAHNTSSEGDPLYGLPLDVKPTALYYNESMFIKAGVLVVSVDEADLDAFNAGEIADRRGKTRADYEAAYPKLRGVTLPKKGYYRSQSPYTGDAVWQKPDQSEVLVFNNRIAMNWDETEDLAMLFTPSYNPSATADFGTDFGYFTEWWFNYGWSVGGDCLEDLTGGGDWNFALLDGTKNYIVPEGGSYTGARTGKRYAAGETLEFLDKLNIGAGETPRPDSEGNYLVGGERIGVRPQVEADAAAGLLGELPSTREAFTRYLKLGAKRGADIDGEGGLAISPNPNTFISRTSMNYFYTEKMAMLAQYSVYMADLAAQAKVRGFTWDVAPLAVYKQYTDPTDPDCDEVAVRGRAAGHSNSIAMVSREGSPRKQQAADFIAWMAGPAGQAVRASMGFFPNQKDLPNDIEFDAGVAPGNVRAFSEAIEYQGAGDWWYMSDYEWILVWSVPLNSKVRNGEMDYADWYKAAIPATNAKLKDY